ncbi:MAG: diguanylate cyclase, partial [Leptolyngbya sp. SIO3F4]|nr:diguanylate cyclase [Leptolyngbya sp. SIO3F4]
MEREALVIGIPEYENFKTLSKTTGDAEQVAQLLETYGGFRVERLPKKLDAAKTGQEIKAGTVSYEQLVKGVMAFLQRAEKSFALIYFTGHGFTQNDLTGLQTGFICPSNCSVEKNNEGIIRDQKKGFSFTQLNHLLEKADLSRLVVLLDCCHSGHFIEQHLVEKNLTAFSGSKDFYLMTACLGLETAKAVKSNDHSVFSGALIRGLSKENKDPEGKISASRLFDFIQRELKGLLQEPMHLGGGGSINLLDYGAAQTQTAAVIDEATGELVCPYRGLAPFEKEHQVFFFGRETLVQNIVKRLHKLPFVPIIGASGSGKSSLVRAGVLPRLQEDGWEILPIIKPGGDPLGGLVEAFKSWFEGVKKGRQLRRWIKDGEKYPKGLEKIVAALPEAQRFVLFVDQFEELFTYITDDEDREYLEQERGRFLELITQVKNLPKGRMRVVMTMRADFLEPCLHYSILHQFIQTQAVFMPPL